MTNPVPAPASPSSQTPKKTWMPTAAGILSIVAGVFDILTGLSRLGDRFSEFHRVMGLRGLGVPLIVLGIVALIGGIFALQRRTWGLALAGAICALIWPSSILGILAIIFVALSKSEFK